MSIFKFTLPTGQPFEIKGPPGLTEAQARAIFDKQAETGALVGFKPGDVLSAATQAADGLPGAQAVLAQAQGGAGGVLGAIGGAIGGAINSAQSALAAAGGALGGSVAGIAAGLTSAVGPAVSRISGALSGSATNAAGAVSSLIGSGGSALTPAVGAATQIATSTVQTLNKALTSTPVTNPINGANFLSASTALAPIASMAVPVVTGVLAQQKNLVGQATSVLNNVTGVGSFGLNASQLETAGFVKPGTAALVSAGTAALSTVLKSPAVWTGKDGIGSVTSLLSNESAQSKIQQGLMATGLAAVSAAGVPVNSLSPQGVAGLALNAAKSVTNTLDYVKGLPIPGDAAGEIKAEFDQAVRDGAFAANFVETKVPPAWKAIDIPVPSGDTVNRDTLNAASSRIAGNPKIPPPNYGPPAPPDENAQVAVTKELQALIVTISQRVNKASTERAAVKDKAAALANQQEITNDQWSALNAELQAFRADYNTNTLPLIVDFESKYERADVTVKRILRADYDTLTTGIKTFLSTSKGVKEQVAALQFKIAGYGDTP
jgi:hypothetical protein